MDNGAISVMMHHLVIMKLMLFVINLVGVELVTTLLLQANIIAIGRLTSQDLFFIHVCTHVNIQDYNYTRAYINHANKPHGKQITRPELM